MRVEINIINSITQSVDASQAKITKATVRALNKTALWVKEQTTKKLSKDIYRLDVAILGETEPHTKNYNGIYERSHQWNNLKTLYPLPQSLLPAIKFAKAQIVLSDSWNLGEINACFPVTSAEEKGSKFLLGSDKLSGVLNKLCQTAFLIQLNFQSVRKEDIKLRHSWECSKKCVKPHF